MNHPAHLPGLEPYSDWSNDPVSFQDSDVPDPVECVDLTADSDSDSSVTYLGHGRTLPEPRKPRPDYYELRRVCGRQLSAYLRRFEVMSPSHYFYRRTQKRIRLLRKRMAHYDRCITRLRNRCRRESYNTYDAEIPIPDLWSNPLGY